MLSKPFYRITELVQLQSTSPSDELENSDFQGSIINESDCLNELGLINPRRGRQKASHEHETGRYCG